MSEVLCGFGSIETSRSFERPLHSLSARQPDPERGGGRERRGRGLLVTNPEINQDGLHLLVPGCNSNILQHKEDSDKGRAGEGGRG
jgi:hypothetical protein